MSFMMYDLIILAIFVLVIGGFLYRKRKNLKKEGFLLLYKTSWGIKLINYVGNKYKRSFKFLSYISVGLGYLLMIGVIWLFYTIVKVYLLRPDVVTVIKVPPIMPLIPYIDKVVPFLPPFYFTYWIIILGVIAITHEFAHGIFAAYNKVKINKTGFGFFPFFLPVFLAAFVELDEKVMVKKPNFGQRAILSAGTFANVITAIFFFVVLFGFFSLSFSPGGVMFDDYSYSVVDVGSIIMINGIAIENPTQEILVELIEDASFNEIQTSNRKYMGVKGFSSNGEQIALYDDAPAIKAELNGAIVEINDEKISNLEELGGVLGKYKVGDQISVKTVMKEETKVYEIELGENPSQKGKAWLGVGFLNRENGGLMSKIFATASSFKKANIYYESKIGEFGWFIYYLLWWLILISISVALVNMLPMGLFDGGRFFYLTILAITGKETWAKNSFKWITYFFLLGLLIVMAFWAYAIFF